MIKPTTAYTACCDGCGHEETHTGQQDGIGLTMLKIILDKGWISESQYDRKTSTSFDIHHYCPACYSIEDGRLIVKPKTKNKPC